MTDFERPTPKRGGLFEPVATALTAAFLGVVFLAFLVLMHLLPDGVIP